MAHQIGGSGNQPPTLTFYVNSLEVRRLLIPEVRGGKNGYLCRTITNAQPQPADKTLDTQTDFEKILVGMRLMEPDAPSRQLADSWPSGMDTTLRAVNRVVGFFTGSRTLDTWLPILH